MCGINLFGEYKQASLHLAAKHYHYFLALTKTYGTERAPALSPAAAQMLVMSLTGPGSVQFTQMPNGLSLN